MHQNRKLTQLWQTPTIRRTRRLASPRLWYRYFTAERRSLPDFIIAGAQKAGTTSLFEFLAGHPRCVASLAKEVHYFDKNFSRGPNWYRMHFPRDAAAANPGLDGRTLAYESSPYYMFDPRVPARVRQTLPDARIIFLLRNPVSRAYSHYHHSVRRGREPLAFEDALAAEAERLDGAHQRLLSGAIHESPAHQNYSYQARGVYVDQLSAWRAHFPAEQLLVLQAERMFKQPGDVLADVLDFLELERWSPAQYPVHNSGRYVAPMSAATRERLSATFAPHNERLFALLGTRYDWR